MSARSPYHEFEGVIGQGYGKGSVIVWDEGGYTLQRTRGGAKPQWLLITRRDDEAGARRTR